MDAKSVIVADLSSSDGQDHSAYSPARCDCLISIRMIILAAVAPRSDVWFMRVIMFSLIVRSA